MYTIIFHKTKHGRVPVQEFINKLNVKTETKVRKYISLLSQEGPDLRRPYSDYLKEGMYELRIKLSPNNYRILYFFVQRTAIVLTHGFVKKTGKVPDREIKKAIKYKLEFEKELA